MGNAMNHIHDAGKAFPLFCSFSIKRRLDASTGKIKVHIKALLESNGPFLLSVLTLARIISPCQPFLCQPLLCQPCHFQPSPPFANLSHLCQLSPSFASLSLLWLPVLPLPTSPFFANHHPPLPASPSFDNRFFLCPPHFSLPSILTVADLHLLHSPMKRCSLGISLDKTPKFLFPNLFDLSSS